MAKVACPFCFSQIDSSRLAFQCLGRGTPKCERRPDPTRVEMTGSTVDSYPTFRIPDGKRSDSWACPHCKAETGRRACPECHTALPADFVDSDSPLIGIVGARSSGKSVWMTVLARQLRDGVAGRFSAHVGFASDNPDGTGSMSAWLNDRENNMFDRLVLPPPTSPEAELRRPPLVIRWQRPSSGFRRGTESTVLSFLDAAGEDLQSVDSVFNLRYLAAIRGLVIVVDPFRFSGAVTMANIPDPQRRVGDGSPTDVVERMTDVLRTEHRVRPRRKISLPIAVVFTKLDAFFAHLDSGSPLRSAVPPVGYYDDETGREVHEQVLSLMGRWNASALDDHLRLNYDTYRYFAVSSLGAEPDYAARRAHPGGIRPHRVEEPVLWLLSRFGVVPAK
jgi:hypothetical protein